MTKRRGGSHYFLLKALLMLEYAELRGSGPPGEIRTPDTQVRSLVLYPAELRAEARSLGTVPQKVKNRGHQKATRCWASPPHCVKEHQNQRHDQRTDVERLTGRKTDTRGIDEPGLRCRTCE
jgi:hypothetical protein